VQDDSGAPELAKIQMVGFTLVAVLIFLADVLHQSRGAVPTAQLPNIDSSLLVLMGISQGGYIGKKLVTIASPFIDKIDPKEILVGGSVTITGGGFGVGTGSSRLTLDSNPIATDTWTDTRITFTVPTEYPSTGPEPWGTYPRVVRLGVDLGGGTTGNEVSLTVTGPAAAKAGGTK
jgi:hypothetical protein